MSPEILRSFDDHAGDPEAVRERLELDAFHADRQRDAHLLAPLRPHLVRLDVFAAICRGADEVSGLHQIVEMPEVVRVLDPKLDLARLRVAMQHTHLVGGHGGRLYFWISSTSEQIASLLSMRDRAGSHLMTP